MPYYSTLLYHTILYYTILYCTHLLHVQRGSPSPGELPSISQLSPNDLPAISQRSHHRSSSQSASLMRRCAWPTRARSASSEASHNTRRSRWLAPLLHCSPTHWCNDRVVGAVHANASGGWCGTFASASTCTCTCTCTCITATHGCPLQGLIRPDEIDEIGEWLGRAPPPPRTRGLVVFDSTGVAVQDGLLGCTSCTITTHYSLRATHLSPRAAHLSPPTHCSLLTHCSLRTLDPCAHLIVLMSYLLYGRTWSSPS